MIVTLPELKTHLRIQTNDEDEHLASLLTWSQTVAEDYCRTTFGEQSPEPVRLAVLLMASHFYECRDSSEKAAYATMMNAFHMLLWPYRVAGTMF